MTENQKDIAHELWLSFCNFQCSVGGGCDNCPMEEHEGCCYDSYDCDLDKFVARFLEIIKNKEEEKQ